VPLNTKLNEANVADTLKGNALIIADNAYVATVWGKKNLKHPNYKKIQP
jgi:hypothetical protein